MTNATNSDSSQREPALLNQIVVLIGGTAGIGLETARRARSVRAPTSSSSAGILSG